MNTIPEHDWPDFWLDDAQTPDKLDPVAQKSIQEYRYLWSLMATLPDEKPSIQSSERFYRFLNDALTAEVQPEKQHSIVKSSWLQQIKQHWQVITTPRFVWQLGFGAVCVCAGLLIGRLFYTPSQLDIEEFAQLRRDVYALQDQVALNMLQQVSASDRLAGIDRIRAINAPAPAATATLLRLLNNDPNVNVRLSAADALMYYVQDNPAVIKQVEESFAKQSSPIVQSVLIEMLMQSKEKSSVRMLEEVRDQTAEPAIKTQIIQSLGAIQNSQQP